MTLEKLILILASIASFHAVAGEKSFQEPPERIPIQGEEVVFKGPSRIMGIDYRAGWFINYGYRKSIGTQCPADNKVVFTLANYVNCLVLLKKPVLAMATMDLLESDKDMVARVVLNLAQPEIDEIAGAHYDSLMMDPASRPLDGSGSLVILAILGASYGDNAAYGYAINAIHDFFGTEVSSLVHKHAIMAYEESAPARNSIQWTGRPFEDAGRKASSDPRHVSSWLTRSSSGGEKDALLNEFMGGINKNATVINIPAEGSTP